MYQLLEGILRPGKKLNKLRKTFQYYDDSLGSKFITHVWKTICIRCWIIVGGFGKVYSLAETEVSLVEAYCLLLENFIDFMHSSGIHTGEIRHLLREHL